MKKQIVAAGLMTMCTFMLATACGTPTKSTMTVSKQTANDASQTNGLSKNGTQTGAADTHQTPTIQLVSFSGLSQTGIQVQVPVGWSKTSITGGDYSGFKFTNPNYPDQTVLVIQSTCVGCYLDASGTPIPQKVIPKNDENIKSTQQTAYSVKYQFTQPKNQNVGNGMLITSKDKAGYAYVETLLPTSQKGISNEVLTSFSYTL